MVEDTNQPAINRRRAIYNTGLRDASKVCDAVKLERTDILHKRNKELLAEMAFDTCNACAAAIRAQIKEPK